MLNVFTSGLLFCKKAFWRLLDTAGAVLLQLGLLRLDHFAGAASEQKPPQLLATGAAAACKLAGQVTAVAAPNSKNAFLKGCTLVKGLKYCAKY